MISGSGLGSLCFSKSNVGTCGFGLSGFKIKLSPSLGPSGFEIGSWSSSTYLLKFTVFGSLSI